MTELEFEEHGNWCKCEDCMAYLSEGYEEDFNEQA